ncbi:MAG: SagB/ThcOx family dehydrogenase [Hyphomicrobiaceae bacterium]
MTEFTLEDAISKRRSHRAFDDRPLPLPIVHKLLWSAQGITGQSGERTVPSAHALHPLHLIVSAGLVTNLSVGAYCVSNDTLKLIPHLDHDLRPGLALVALDDQPWISSAPAILTICADMVSVSQAFVEQPPFGVRGRRYAYIEAGAAAQNIQLQACAEGLACVLIAGFRDEATADVLNLQEPYEPIAHLCIGWPAVD